MVVLTTCAIIAGIAGIATPILGGFVMFLRNIIRAQKNSTMNDTEYDTYVELPNRHNKTYDRISFLNTTLCEAAACDCPILCELLINHGATTLDKALEIAATNGQTAICKLLIDKGAHNILEALEIARQNKKRDVQKLIEDLLCVPK